MKNLSKKKWNNFSKSDFDLFKLINQITEDNDCPYFLIGAKARDILLGYFQKSASLRATLDTDIAICCKNWDEFYKIKTAFLENGNFTADKKHEHRIASSEYGHLDILPFGDINEGIFIKWPPEYDIELSLIGFEDAYKNAMNIEIDTIRIKVPSPLGFIVLKLFAWLGRREKKDAVDLDYYTSNYLGFENQNRLEEEHNDLLDKFDYTLSGGRLLGRDLKNFSSETKNRLEEFFNDADLMDKLAIAMSYDYQLALNTLNAIKQGFND